MFKKRIIQLMAVTVLTFTGFCSMYSGQRLVQARNQEYATELSVGNEDVSLVVSQKKGSNEFDLALTIDRSLNKSIACLEISLQFDQSRINDITMSQWASSLKSSQCRASYDASTGVFRLYVVDNKDLKEQDNIAIGTMKVESNEKSSFTSAFTLDAIKIVDLSHTLHSLVPGRETISFEYTTEGITTPTLPPKPTITPSKPTESPTQKPTPTETPTEPPKQVMVESIRLDKSKATIKVGKKTTFEASVLPSNASNKKVKWTSSNTKVAKVNSKGVVTGLKPGNVIIQATSTDGANVYKKATVTVKEVEVKKISVSFKKITLTKGKTKKIKVKVTPANATNQKVTFTSSKPKVATVGKKGKITAKSKGEAVITIKAANGVSKRVTVTVQ